MLSIGLTGGIAAGKSLLAARFKELGALLIDADQLARDVVAPGTPGLAAVVERFGTGVLHPDGSLDRPALGALVFADPQARNGLNVIVHPLVRAAAKELQDNAGPGDIVVQDIPLLVETGQGANFHLVVVVQAAETVRLERMVRERGMSEADARARMAAQASDDQRGEVADVVIVNDGEPQDVLAELDRLWHRRLLPFAENLAQGVPALENAAVEGGTEQDSARDGGAARAARIKARLTAAAGEAAVVVPSTGGGTENSRRTGDVLEFDVRARGGKDLAHVAPALTAAGFPPVPHAAGMPHMHASADPGRPVVVHLKVG